MQPNTLVPPRIKLLTFCFPSVRYNATFRDPSGEPSPDRLYNLLQAWKEAAAEGEQGEAAAPAETRLGSCRGVAGGGAGAGRGAEGGGAGRQGLPPLSWTRDPGAGLAWSPSSRAMSSNRATSSFWPSPAQRRARSGSLWSPASPRWLGTTRCAREGCDLSRVHRVMQSSQSASSNLCPCPYMHQRSRPARP